MPRWAAWNPESGDRAWVERSACGSDVADLFFPVPRAGAGLPDYSPAQAICRSCPVREQCFAYAVSVGELAKGKEGWYSRNGGVWAGVAPKSPKQIAKARKAG